jgi:hypothetical protein
MSRRRLRQQIQSPMQTLRHRACTHPHVLQARPKRGQDLKIWNIDQREVHLIERDPAWRCDHVTPRFGERVVRLSVRHRGDRLAGIARDRADDV